MIHATAFVHLRAHVEDVTIGPWAKVWQFASVTRGAVIGEECVLSPGCMIDGSRIGDRSKIGPGAKMGPGFIIGSDVFIGPNVVLCNDAWPSADASGFDIDALLAGRLISIRIEDRAIIGANATVLPGVTIGAGACVAAGAVCERSLPAGHLLRRDGSTVEIDQARTPRRMRSAS